MSPLEIANILGFIAAGIGIVMYIPQALRISKTKDTKSISLFSFLFVALASVFWLGYGLILSAAPVLVVNFVVLIVSLYIALMKIKYG